MAALHHSGDIRSSHISKLDDNLSVYSISEDLNNPNLSDLYDMLGDDSIEIRRSESLTESPFKTSSPLKFSPTKKLKNDYQDHVLRARSGSNLESPTKRKGTTLLESFDTVNNSHSYDSIERNIERFLTDRTIPISSNLLEKDIEDFDKTELIIRETHKLINNVPESILGNKEGEKFSKLLNTSITQLIKSLESVKRHNNELKLTNERLGDKQRRAAVEKSALEREIDKLKNENYKLEVTLAGVKLSESTLKEEVQQLQRKVGQQVPHQNAQIRRENNLLREKLIKYKNLADEGRKENDELKKKGGELDKVQKVLTERELEPEPEPEKILKGESKLGDLFQQISKQLKEEKPQEAKPKYTYKLLPLFEELIDNLKKEQPPPASEDKQTDTAKSTTDQSDHDDRLLRKVMNTMDINNKLYSRILLVVERDDQDKMKKNTNTNTNTNSKNALDYDEVVKCYCRRERLRGAYRSAQERGSPKNNDGGAEEPVALRYLQSQTPEEDIFTEASEGLSSQGRGTRRTTCPRCSAGFRSDTLNLMGEYKWSI